MAEGLGGYQTLNADDVTDVFEELLPAQIKTYELGLKLKLPQHEVESIHSMYTKPKDRLLQVLIEFLNQGGATWKIIVEALRSATVNLPALAKTVAAAHADCNVVSPMESGAKVNDKHLDINNKEIEEKSRPVDPDKLIALEAEIEVFHERFNSIKEMTIRGLEKCCLSVVTVVFMLTNIRKINEHKVFLKENHKALCQCEDHLELFGSLNFYWNYLAYDLLDNMIKELAKKHKFFNSVAGEMAVYKKDLEGFRKQTALVMFCKTEPPMLEDPPAGFQKIVFRVDWPERATLDDAENFRRQYARCYDLPTCAIMLAHIGIGSFIISCFVPSQVVNMLRKKRALGVLIEYRVKELTLDISNEVCLFQSSTNTQWVPPPVAAANTQESTNKKKSNVEEVYRFSEEPGKEYFCPVTTSLLLHPHLTSCCGNHLSCEAANKLQTDGHPCPLCKQKIWSTILNKHFQRQVNSLLVFCCNVSRGCGWQGEVCAFHNHVQSCSMKENPLIKDTQVLPMYYGKEITPDRRVNEKRICIANCDYAPMMVEDNIAFTKGDSLEILHTTQDKWLVRCLATGNKGYIPSNLVTPIWFFGPIQKHEAESLLMSHRVKGMFLIRNSQSKREHLALSIYDGLDIRHSLIYCKNSVFFISEELTFTTLIDLVDKYSESNNGLPLKLGSPCPHETLITTTEIIEESPKESIKLLSIKSKNSLWDEFKGTWNDMTVQGIVLKGQHRIETKSLHHDVICIMKKLHHKNVVEFYTYSTEVGEQILITEFVSQVDLLCYIRGKQGVLKLPKLISMADQVALGIMYLELNNYVHGDLSANNVMVGKGNICKIKNFGLSRIIYCDTEFESVNMLEKFQVKWMAPEAAIHRQFSVKSDVWSFGVLLYELFTYGQVPYPALSNLEVMRLIRKGYRLPCPLNTPQKLYNLMLGTWKGTVSNRLTFEYLHSALDDYTIEN